VTSMRSAEPRDAAAVVDLIGESFDPAFVQRTIFGCAGAERFLAAQFGLASPLRSSTYHVTCVGPTTVGYAEINRNSDTNCFLSYIAVATESRRSAVGSRLLLAAVLASECSPHGRLELDVLVGSPARAWYERIGLQEVSRVTWWESKDWTASSTTGSGFVFNLPQAEAAHERFGFSEIRAGTRSNPRKVGKLGERYFRVDDTLIVDDDCVAALRALDATRSLLLIKEGLDNPCDRGHWTPVVRLVRMAATLEDVISGLTRVIS
jgi:ribosomal protein S18 acetylase RimI-like enzyme